MTNAVMRVPVRRERIPWAHTDGTTAAQHTHEAARCGSTLCLEPATNLIVQVGNIDDHRLIRAAKVLLRRAKPTGSSLRRPAPRASHGNRPCPAHSRRRCHPTHGDAGEGRSARHQVGEDLGVQSRSVAIESRSAARSPMSPVGHDATGGRHCLSIARMRASARGDKCRESRAADDRPTSSVASRPAATPPSSTRRGSATAGACRAPARAPAG